MPGITETSTRRETCSSRWQKRAPVPSGILPSTAGGQNRLSVPGGFQSKLLLSAVPSVSSSSFNWYLVSAGTDVSSEIWAVLWELVTGVIQCPCKINYTLYF